MKDNVKDLLERAKPVKPASVNVSFTLPSEEYGRLSEICGKVQVQVPDVMRRLVRDFLKEADGV